MERIKNNWRNLSLRKAFMVTVLLAVCMIVLLSAVTILLCLWGRHYLLPNADLAYLTLEKEYSNGTVFQETILISMKEGEWKMPYGMVDSENSTVKENADGELIEPELEESVITKYGIAKAEDAYSYLTPKRKLAYRALGIGMVLLPVIYALLGILLTAAWFYRHKLSQPILQLQHAIDQIHNQNLDFTVESVSGDELGQVCSSLEKMRQALYQNNQSLWNMLEERKRLQASVAHDLRNPITIIQTYAEYFKRNLKAGKPAEESWEDMVGNLQAAAKRLEQYTDSIRDISKLEEIEIHPEPVNLAEVLPEMAEELELLADKEGKAVVFEMEWREADDEQDGIESNQPAIKDMYVNMDTSVLYRILENLVSNASRYARETIWIRCVHKNGQIDIIVSDDGSGFAGKVLSRQNHYFVTTDAENGHLGMGLSISRILCRKLGGRMQLRNRQQGGAEVKICLRL